MYGEAARVACECPISMWVCFNTFEVAGVELYSYVIANSVKHYIGIIAATNTILKFEGSNNITFFAQLN